MQNYTLFPTWANSYFLFFLNRPLSCIKLAETPLKGCHGARNRMYKYATVLHEKWINLPRAPLRIVYLRATVSSVANSRVLRGFVICLSYSGLRILTIQRQVPGLVIKPVSGHDIGFIRPWYSANQALIWCISQAKTGFMTRAPEFPSDSGQTRLLRKSPFCAIRHEIFRPPFSILRIYFVKIFYYQKWINMQYGVR